MTRYFRPHLAATLAAFAFCAPASANSIDDLTGDYTLQSSTTVPASNWGYSKARISIRKLDDRHVLILLACEWKRDPKSVCGDHYFAQQRDGSVYLQDMNSDWLRFYFDPANRSLAIVSRGADNKESVRRDIFTPTSAPLEDRALVRRMKREQGSAEHKESVRVFGHYSKRAYLNNRIEFQKNP
ncbi:hypothetical protein [Pseudoduganella umbonata]|uniref:Uncharacterized protein n=1 Tax=Pseudoduganella umbonata TaxID=864828 RepID=A0A4P8HZV8_9BURK|nr:hypothetical protein [Pseudoduganella umbonata]MBB3224089.1 hypothetical protein [Pseudoduganella umbonata]QCP14044.1 hypothetical protein FCL38_29240 [Pseudoduganella umbonata]